ncbi:lipoyl(octanoyl) transferase LipB [Marinobacter koreensis]|uniref:Octanoyltransferase n=1 Tax=Marinobacter koreensis TaxID=335974 RepID=A0ABW0RM07_9GAMM|nr:lipoyl(octanoyl) transferase LipB [Marinobacter koreensis]MCK7549206.1 lipoyl(octanoyl) transferase LipB [Marinobacter koreensis]
MPDLIVRRLGEQPYQETWDAMKQFTADRDGATADEIWCLEHPRVFTQGQAGKAEHLLFPGDIPVIKVDRGGQVTYHGPGQLVVYLMLDLPRKKMGVRSLVDTIEQGIVGTLGDLGVEAAARPDAPGVYVGDAKIASLGLRVRRGCSFHGLALNVAMDMEPFSRINPCGYAGMAMCQVTDFVPGKTVADLETLLVRHLVDALSYSSVSYRDGW